MRALRWLGAGVVWILAGVVGLLGVVLSVTLILLPLGIPLLMVARRLAALATAMVVPHAVRHPVDALGKKGSDLQGKAEKKARSMKKRKRFGHKSTTDKVIDWVLS
jgi:hypothetical protein